MGILECRGRQKEGEEKVGATDSASQIWPMAPANTVAAEELGCVLPTLHPSGG